MYDDMYYWIASALYFFYPIAFAFMMRTKRPVLVGVTAHGVNIALIVLCMAIYSPVYMWVMYVAPSLEDFGYLRNIDWILHSIHSVQEIGYVIWFFAGLITPYVLCKRTFRSSGSPSSELI